MKKITPFLWFDDKAEEAARFYVSVFPNSKIVSIARYGDAGAQAAGRRKGTVMTVEFELDGQKFMGLNGGPEFSFSHAVSFVVNCETQEEIDRFWKKLSEGGQEVECGWLADKYGLSWQIVPTVLGRMMTDPDSAKSDRVMQALLGMKKLDIAELQRAYSGESIGETKDAGPKRAAG